MNSASESITLLREQASAWVAKLHSKTCTAEDRREFAAWRAQSPAHAHIYQEMEAFWRNLQGLDALASPQLDAARNYLKQARIRRRAYFRTGLALASIVLVAIVFFPHARLWWNNGTYYTLKGERKHIVLADGSRIELNTDSELRVRFSASIRTIKLARGEALFSVAHDDEKVFEVIAGDLRIQDIGTRFNVYRRQQRIDITVLEGEVSVASERNPAARHAAAGQQLSYANDRFIFNKHADLASAAAWREGRMVFKGQALSEVLQELGRYHNVALSLQPSSLQTLKVTGDFPVNDLKLTLDTLAASLPVRINTLNSKEIIITGADMRTQ